MFIYHTQHLAMFWYSTYVAFGERRMCVWNEGTKMNSINETVCVCECVCMYGSIALRRKLVNLACAWDVPIYPFQ